MNALPADYNTSSFTTSFTDYLTVCIRRLVYVNRWMSGVDSLL